MKKPQVPITFLERELSPSWQNETPVLCTILLKIELYEGEEFEDTNRPAFITRG